MSKDRVIEAYNIATGKEITIDDIEQCIDSKVKSNKIKVDVVHNYIEAIADMSRIKNEMCKDSPDLAYVNSIIDKHKETIKYSKVWE